MGKYGLVNYMRLVYLTIAVSALGCGSVVSPSDVVVLDAEHDASNDAMDASGTDAIDGAVVCAPSPTERPASSYRSCTDGAPMEHCREVWGCGGDIPVGSRSAYINTPARPEELIPQRPECDIGRARVRAGFIDAYEVSVARFRAWARAGFPQPPSGWMSPLGYPLLRVEIVLPEGVGCTYRAEPGDWDNLPVNCVGQSVGEAFCAWEGKHLVTETMWDYFATNRGTTALPFGNVVPRGAARCQFGDVGANDDCASSHPDGLPLPIDALPMGATLDPPGVFGMWGGVGELTPRDRSRDSQTCGPSGIVLADYDFDIYGALRGGAFIYALREAAFFDHAATRIYRWQLPMQWFDLRARGIRCARWVPEAR